TTKGGNGDISSHAHRRSPAELYEGRPCCAGTPRVRQAPAARPYRAALRRGHVRDLFRTTRPATAKLESRSGIRIARRTDRQADGRPRGSDASTRTFTGGGLRGHQLD